MNKLELLEAQLDDCATVYEKTIEDDGIVLQFSAGECDILECTPEDSQFEPFTEVRITPGNSIRVEIRFDTPSSVNLIRKLPA